jgi:geranylgeranyl diphosphate synthase type II
MASFQETVNEFEVFLSKQHFPASPKTLYEPCEYLLQLGGKRIRPAMCLMSSDLFSTKTENSFFAATAIEIFHNFTLVHDDIMDKAPTRRGQKTVHEKYNLPVAILSGDVLCIMAYQFLNKINHQAKDEIIELFNKTAIEICEGQQLDMDFETKENLSKNEYLNMIRLKTAVLLACSMKIGALLGNANEKDAQLMYEIGEDIGLAFQVKDDYLDAFGEANKTGKQQGGDIIANKKTILVAEAFELANKDEKIQLHKLQFEDENSKVEKTLQFFKKLGVDQRVIDLKNNYTNQAFIKLEELNIDVESKKHLIELTQFLLDRES